MSNYFKSVNTKSSTQVRKHFSNEECRFDLLTDYYKNQQRRIESDLNKVDAMYMEWCDLLFNSYNIVVHGRQSKFRLLETFAARYLSSGKIPDFHCQSSKNGSSTLNITTVRMHGMSQVSMERFCHGLFGIQTSMSDIIEERDKFLTDARQSKTHYVFLMHSFELLFQNCNAVCELIFQLYKCDPEYIHILLSSDHIYSGKILNKFKFQLQLIFFDVPYGESFFHEKTHVASTIVQDDTDDIADRLFMGQLNLNSLKDIYQAMQSACKEIMLYILNEFVRASTEIETEAMRDSNKRVSRRLITHQIRSTEIEFDKLLDHCRAKLFIHRAQIVRNHIGELQDHGIVTYDEKTKKLSCLMSVDICKKFLDSIKPA